MRALLALLALASYDEACDRIVEQGQLASRLFNQGETAAAAAAVKRAELAFHQATADEPNEPQAFASMAQFLHNSNRLAEALPLWRRARELVGDSPRMQALLAAREGLSRYGAASKARDEAYAEGQGDVHAAMARVRDQLDVYPAHPAVLHDLGTLLLMAGASDARAAQEAPRRFDEAEAAAAAAWGEGAQASGRCRGGASVVAGAGALVDAQIAVADAASAGFVAAVPKARLLGSDAVVATPLPGGRCGLLQGTEGSFRNLAHQVQLVRSWDRGNGEMWFDAHHGRVPNHGAAFAPPLALGHVACVVVSGRRLPGPQHDGGLKPQPPQGYASTAFYHFVAEVAPKLLLLAPHLAADTGLRVLVPARALDPDGFMARIIRRLAQHMRRRAAAGEAMPPDLEGRLDAYPASQVNDVRAEVEQLLWPTWDPGTLLPRSARRPGAVPHCLTPPPLLRELREALAPPGGWPARGEMGSVLWITRRSVGTRALMHEPEVLAAVRVAAGAANRPVVEFDGSASLEDALACVLWPRRSAGRLGPESRGPAGSLQRRPSSSVCTAGR